LFELGVGFLQIRGHAVELACEPFELVAGMDLDTAIALVGADPCRPVCNSRIGPVIRRVIAKAAMVAIPSPTSSSTRLRAAWPWSGANASASGTSTKTSQPSGAIAACAVYTDPPPMLLATLTAGCAPGPADAADSAAATCGNFASSVSRNTRLISRWAISRPRPSTT
jgi:hypothetical protein